MNQYFNFFFLSTHAFSLFSSNHVVVFSKKLKIEKKSFEKNVKTDATGLSGLCRKIFIRRGLWGWFLKIVWIIGGNELELNLEILKP